MLKSLTEAEKRALNNLLYLVTSHEELRTAVLSSYGRLRVGNSGMPESHEFAMLLETLHAKSCK